MRAAAGDDEPVAQPRKWQATQWPSLLCLSWGATVLQRGNWAIGQRVWKWQPDGGLIGLGTSPCSRMRLRLTRRVGHRHRREQRLGVGMQRVARRAPRAGAISTIRPRYITATRSLMCSTTDRSWAMKR